ncbi:TPA: oligosaccharide repeat unit polymerase [Vibrio cholerae]|uniref:Putative polymerase n=1 Tax=Vibrio cholerae TaxID=666 RepID=A0T1U3_VIBCL|nr:putative polymerase [Vibrio cholerae]
MNLERNLFFKLYLFSNIVTAIIYIYSGKIGGDLRGYDLNHPLIMLLALIIVIVSMYTLLYFLYGFLEKSIKVKKIFLEDNIDYFYLDVFFILLNISFGYFSFKYDIGIAGVEIDSSVPKIPLYLFIIMQPIFLTYIYLAYTSNIKRKLFVVNAILILLFSILKGWLSSFIYLTFIFIIVNNAFIFKHKLKFMLGIVVGIVLSPFLKFFKSVVSVVNTSQNGDSYIEAIDLVMSYKNINSLLDLFNLYLVSTIERFEHVGILYYSLVENNIDVVLKDKITPFFAEGWIQNRIYDVFTLHSTTDLQIALAQKIHNAYSWRVNTPISLWMIVDSQMILLIAIYTITLLMLVIFISKLLSEKVVNLSWIATLVMLFHGWFYSFSLYIQALVVFACIVFFIRIVKA